MVKKILSVEGAIKATEQLRKQGKKIVLAGGCFDILHVGHVHFLQEAKKQGDYLMLLLESDERIKQLKGQNRPINIQKDRAFVLSAVTLVDCIVLLPLLKSDALYDKMILKLKPDIIATTKGDPFKMHKQRQAKLINSRLVEVIDHISNQSTSRLAMLLRDTI
ncbi:MAG: adenylyltransferase/cytidyltransferase family protein [Candidatus Levybacteria bacterium]|nr:adenylyltransferase/cytidyltransferase family protein [Candidatus Levybacteria bacterium]